MENSNLEPYVTHHPTDPITAEGENEKQVMIKEDIRNQIQQGIAEIESVPHAEDADKLGGKTPDELSEEIVERALSQIPERTGYRQLFKKLTVGEETVIEHGLMTWPLVDLYQLDYFQVVASEDDYRYVTWVNFYLYHSSEKRIRFKEEDAPSTALRSIEIEPTDSHPYRIPFKDMLAHYSIPVEDDASLGDLETEFWKAFFAAPNDEFDDDQYTHSPWFDRCCREQTPVRTLKRKRDWDDLWFQMRPRRTINYPITTTLSDNAPGRPPVGLPLPAPTQIQVSHFDLNTLGMTLLLPASYPAYLMPPDGGTPPEDFDGLEEHRWEQVRQELKVMVLLKV
jgi:hypothetical protein